MLRVSNVARNQLELNMEQQANQNPNQEQVNLQQVSRTWLGQVFHTLGAIFSGVANSAEILDATAQSYGSLMVAQADEALVKKDEELKASKGYGIEQQREKAESIHKAIFKK